MNFTKISELFETVKRAPPQRSALYSKIRYLRQITGIPRGASLPVCADELLLPTWLITVYEHTVYVA